MRRIGIYKLKLHLVEVLNAVERGHSVVVTRHGKPIAQIVPHEKEQTPQPSEAARAIRNFPRSPLPKGDTNRSLVEQGRR